MLYGKAFNRFLNLFLMEYNLLIKLRLHGRILLENIAVAGDFAMLMDEVQPVIKTLIENEIEVVAVHNDMVHLEPKIFFLHYWGVGPTKKLAKGLKAGMPKPKVCIF